MQRKVTISFFLSDIFAGARFVEIQKLCYHGNVTVTTSPPYSRTNLSQKMVITLTFSNDRIPSKFIDMHRNQMFKSSSLPLGNTAHGQYDFL